MVKARIALHGNMNEEKDGLSTHSAVCPPIGIWGSVSLATIFQFYVVYVDTKNTFLQTGEALWSA